MVGFSNNTASTSSTTDNTFNPTHCLFCLHTSSSSTSNLKHMRSTHGFSIPSPSSLLVDEETLLGYLYLVINQYNQCLGCGSEHLDAEAAQHHILAKDHCNFDLESEGSEFREFYGFESSEESEESQDNSEDENEDHKDVMEEEEELESEESKDVATTRRLDEGEMRLASGKIITHRSARLSRPPPKLLSPSPDDSNFALATSSPSPPQASLSSPRGSSEPSATTTSLTRAAKTLAFHITQLSHLRASDRASLMHLPASQQRAVLASQEKQMARELKKERRYRGRVEGRGNKVLMGRFRADCPGGRTNG